MSRFFLLTIFLTLAAFSGVEAQQTRGFTSETSGPDFRAEVEKQTFLLVNQYRKKSDLSPLAWDDAITKTARAHSKDMATGEVDFGHEGFSDRVKHLKTVMTGLQGAGENVLYTSDLDDVAKRAVALWLRSPHHLENIRGDYNYSGLGVWQDKNGVIYFTQIFVKIGAPPEETETAPLIVLPFGLFATPYTRTMR